MEKIKALESKLLSSDKADAIFLQKQNKEYEQAISSLNKNIHNINMKNNEENKRFKSMIGEIMILKDQLTNEIESMEKLKSQIADHQIINDTSNEVKKKKVELVLKYNEPHSDKKDDGSNDEEDNSHHDLLLDSGKNYY